jgi:hypothetical protein
MNVDLTRTDSQDFELANNLLAPTIATLRNITSQPDIDIWKLTNWIFVSYYWAFLTDVGQIAPTTYVPLNQWANANFSYPTFHSPNYNIFVNASLFEIYMTYMNDTIFPFLQYGGIGEISPLTTDNQLTAGPATFIQVYNCTERTLKSAIAFILSVFATLWAVTHVLYALVRWITGRFARWDSERGETLFRMATN